MSKQVSNESINNCQMLGILKRKTFGILQKCIYKTSQNVYFWKITEKVSKNYSMNYWLLRQKNLIGKTLLVGKRVQPTYIPKVDVEDPLARPDSE
jgi:hypothetical protein